MNADGEDGSPPDDQEIPNWFPCAEPDPDPAPSTTVVELDTFRRQNAQPYGDCDTEAGKFVWRIHNGKLLCVTIPLDEERPRVEKITVTDGGNNPVKIDGDGEYCITLAGGNAKTTITVKGTLSVTALVSSPFTLKVTWDPATGRFHLYLRR